MIVFDAGVLVGHLQSEDPFHLAASDFLDDNEEGEWAASAVTVAECLIHAVRVGRGNSMVGALERMGVIQLALTSDDALGFAEVKNATKLRMPDAIVVYTAERHGADLVTTDRAVAAAAETRGVRVRLLSAGSLAA